MSPFTALPSVQLGHGRMEGAAWVLQLSGWVEVWGGLSVVPAVSLLS